MDGNNGFDILKMAELISSMKSSGDGTNAGESTQKSAFDIGTIIQLMELMKSQSNSEPNPGFSKDSSSNINERTIDTENEEKKPPPKYYDDQINTPGLLSIKAAIPYLDFEYQRKIGVLIKLLELKKLLEMYSQTAIQISSTKDYKRGMLTAIRPHMTEDKRNKIDILLKLIDIDEIVRKSKNNVTDK